MTHGTFSASRRGRNCHRALSSLAARLRPLTSAHALLAVLVAATLAVSLTACNRQDYYKFPEFTYAGRPVPPSLLAERVLVSVARERRCRRSAVIVDALRDIRNNVENTHRRLQHLRLQWRAAHHHPQLPEQSSAAMSITTPLPTRCAGRRQLRRPRPPAACGLNLSGQLRTPSPPQPTSGARVYGAQEQTAQLVVSSITSPAASTR